MQEVRRTLIETEKTTLLLMTGCLILSLILGWYFFAYGLLIGSVLGILNFRLLARNVTVFSLKKRGNPVFYFLCGYLARFLMVGIVFSLCLVKELSLFFGSVVGFLFIQTSIVINNFLLYRE